VIFGSKKCLNAGAFRHFLLFSSFLFVGADTIRPHDNHLVNSGRLICIVQ